MKVDVSSHISINSILCGMVNWCQHYTELDIIIIFVHAYQYTLTAGP